MNSYFRDRIIIRQLYLTQNVFLKQYLNCVFPGIAYPEPIRGILYDNEIMTILF